MQIFLLKGSHQNWPRHVRSRDVQRVQRRSTFQLFLFSPYGLQSTSQLLSALDPSGPSVLNAISSSSSEFDRGFSCSISKKCTKALWFSEQCASESFRSAGKAGSIKSRNSKESGMCRSTSERSALFLFSSSASGSKCSDYSKYNNRGYLCGNRDVVDHERGHRGVRSKHGGESPRETIVAGVHAADLHMLEPSALQAPANHTCPSEAAR